MRLSLCSATDLAIAIAIKAGTLETREREGRFGTFWSLEDERGLIEVHNTKGEAESRVQKILEKLSN